MSLLSRHRQAAQALSANTDVFATTAVVTDPDGAEYEINVLESDTGELIDTETQLPVSGRNFTLVMGDAARDAVGMGRPIAVRGGAPWRVAYQGETWRVYDSRYDRTMGLTTVFLEEFDGL